MQPIRVSGLLTACLMGLVQLLLSAAAHHRHHPSSNSPRLVAQISALASVPIQWHQAPSDLAPLLAFYEGLAAQFALPSLLEMAALPPQRVVRAIRLEYHVKLLDAIVRVALRHPEYISALATSGDHPARWPALHPTGERLARALDFDLCKPPLQEDDGKNEGDGQGGENHDNAGANGKDHSARPTPCIAYLMAAGRLEALREAFLELLESNRHRSVAPSAASGDWAVAELEIRCRSKIITTILHGDALPAALDGMSQEAEDHLSGLLGDIVCVHSSNLFSALHDATRRVIAEGDTASVLARLDRLLDWGEMGGGDDSAGGDAEEEVAEGASAVKLLDELFVGGASKPPERTMQFAALIDRARARLVLEALRINLLSTRLKLARLIEGPPPPPSSGPRMARLLTLYNRDLFELTKVEWIATLHVVFELTAGSNKLQLSCLRPFQDFMHRQTVNGGLRRAYRTLRQLADDILNTSLYRGTGPALPEESRHPLHESLRAVYGELVGTLQSLDGALALALNRWPRMPDWDQFVLQLCAGGWAGRFLVMACLIMHLIQGRGLLPATLYEWRTVALLRPLPPISAPGDGTGDAAAAADEWDWPIGGSSATTTQPAERGERQ